MFLIINLLIFGIRFLVGNLFLIAKQIAHDPILPSSQSTFLCSFVDCESLRREYHSAAGRLYPWVNIPTKVSVWVIRTTRILG